MTDEDCIRYLENISRMFERGKENCAGDALELQQKHIDALQYAICHLTAAELEAATMDWITEHNITIIDINYDTKACYVEHNGKRYGCPLRQHDGDWYFSLDDRCVWYLVK